MDWFSPPLHHHGLPQSVILEFTQTNSLRPNLYVGPASRGPKDFLRAGSDLGASDEWCLMFAMLFIWFFCLTAYWMNVNTMSIKRIMMLVWVSFSLKGREHTLFLKWCNNEAGQLHWLERVCMTLAQAEWTWGWKYQSGSAERLIKSAFSSWTQWLRFKHFINKLQFSGSVCLTFSQNRIYCQ